MSARDTCQHFNERCCSRLPVKVPHVKYKDGRKYPCFCGRMHPPSSAQSPTTDLGIINPVKSNPEYADKATEMSIKNFYDSYILEGLLNTNAEIKKCGNVVTDDTDPLSDIKNILLTTNDKLDLILNTLTDKKEQLFSSLCKEPVTRQRRWKLKPRTRSENLKTPSRLSLPLKEEEMGDLPCMSCPWAKCVSSTCVTRLRPSPYYVSPYFPPYYVKPISHYNYLKIFGPKYSDPDMSNNLWSPFMFMATSFNVKKLQDGINNDKMRHPLDNDTDNPFCFDEEHAEGIECSEDGNCGFSRCIEENAERVTA